MGGRVSMFQGISCGGGVEASAFLDELVGPLSGIVLDAHQFVMEGYKYGMN